MAGAALPYFGVVAASPTPPCNTRGNVFSAATSMRSAELQQLLCTAAEASLEPVQSSASTSPVGPVSAAATHRLLVLNVFATARRRHVPEREGGHDEDVREEDKDQARNPRVGPILTAARGFAELALVLERPVSCGA